MRYRLNEYTIVGNTIELYTDVTIEDIRLIVNETQGVVICSSMQKSNITSITTRDTGFSTITIPTSVCELAEGDKLTIEIDKGENLSIVESKLEEGVGVLSSKIDNIQLPNIDTSELAKQGENQEATNSAILSAIGDVEAALTHINETLDTL